MGHDVNKLIAEASARMREAENNLGEGVVLLKKARGVIPERTAAVLATLLQSFVGEEA